MLGAMSHGIARRRFYHGSHKLWLTMPDDARRCPTMADKKRLLETGLQTNGL
ncbi:MAG: hypothetical protein WA783_03865 [Phormidesmis sp.]